MAILSYFRRLETDIWYLVRETYTKTDVAATRAVGIVLAGLE